MSRPSIAESIGDLEIRICSIPLESTALDPNLGVFDTPLVSAWKVQGEDNSELGFIFEYSEVPKTWSDALVKEHLRRTGSNEGNIVIPEILRWVRMVGEYGPAFARNKDEAMLLFDLDIQRSRFRRELQ